MNIQEGALTLKGEIKSPDLAEEKVLSEMMKSMEKGIFKQVSLVNTKKSSAPDKLTTFELKLSVQWIKIGQ